MNTTPTGHTINHTYLSKYWKDTYTVMCVNKEGETVVKWSDGHITEHQTHVGQDKDLLEIMLCTHTS